MNWEECSGDSGRGQFHNTAGICLGEAEENHENFNSLPGQDSKADHRVTAVPTWSANRD